MRVLVVGTPAERQTLRSELPVSVVVAGEFATLSEARAAGIAADAILLPPSRGTAVDEDATPGESLSAREQQVLELLAEGLPNKAIATRLGISDQTVKFHVASIAAKLGAANRTEAVRLALRRGLLTL
jgi:DNA-binding NarL/FixJ family response regulator